MTSSEKQTSTLGRIWPIVALLLLLVLFFNKLAFTNLILARGDTFLYFYPYWSIASEALRAGDIPLWNPAIFMGAPLLANSQMGFFYPFNWPVWVLLETPYALSMSILIHLFIAGFGTYFAARRVMLLDRPAAFVSAVVFALGGYLVAQVEHINQLQGLAWMPWLLLVVGQGSKKDRPQQLLKIIAAGFLFSLQLLAGHMQTAFISAVGLVLWTLTHQFLEPLAQKEKRATKTHLTRTTFTSLLLLLTGGLLALFLAAIQLLPTLELTTLSARQGGLPTNEVLSFSLNPLLLTRSLLPTYGQSLFTEYVAHLPLVVLALALIGAWQWRRRPGVLSGLVWVVIAVFLALGVFNPFNWLLARLPGFNLFRAPARWLALYALGMALLAGVGWQILLTYLYSRLKSANAKVQYHRLPREIYAPLLLFLTLFLSLAAWGFVAGLLVDMIPLGTEASFENPSVLTLVFWAVEISVLALICLLLYLGRPQRTHDLMVGFLTGMLLLVLFLSSRALPYNNPTTPEAFFDLRPSTTRLMAETDTPPERVLSLSDIFFDPGDQAEIDSIYHDQLSQSAQYDYTIAVKQKEIMSPNLPMLFGLASVDGFDGGVLPIQSYTELMKLILPEGIVTTDGRLREHLTAIPDARWLDLFNARFLITDKVGDIWRDGVFFDRQHPLQLHQGEEAALVGYLPDFEATGLLLLASSRPGQIQIKTETGQVWDISPSLLDEDLYQAIFPVPARPQKVTIAPCPDVPSCELSAVSMVDQRDNTFHPLVLGQYRMIHSGDVKIYENIDVLPRAFLVPQWEWEADNENALTRMGSPAFNPRLMAILSPSGEELPPFSQVETYRTLEAVELKEYTSRKVAIATKAQSDGMLVLTDTYFPGWRATVDGQPTQIYPANILFRAVFVPAGTHEVVFSFAPDSFRVGIALTLAALAIVSIILINLLLFMRKQ